MIVRRTPSYDKPLRIERRSCGCTVWPIVLFFPVRRCGKCGNYPDEPVDLEELN